MARRSVEPLLWILFSAGGVMSALFMPVSILLLAVAVPLGWIDPPSHEHLQQLFGHPLTGLVVLALCALSLLHWAHRFRYTLYDGLQIKHLNEVINALCYGGAVVGSIAAAYLLFL
jgi:fumarate reductase subunit D